MKNMVPIIFISEPEVCLEQKRNKKSGMRKLMTLLSWFSNVNEFDFAEHFSSQHNLFVTQVMRYTDKQLKRQANRLTRMVFWFVDIQYWNQGPDFHKFQMNEIWA